MKTTGILVSSLTEFTTGVQTCQNQFDCRNPELGMDINGNSPSIIRDTNRAILIDRDIDLIAIPREMLIDRVIQNLEDAVMQSTLIRVSDIHSGTLPNGLKTLEFVDLTGTIFLVTGNTHFIDIWLLAGLLIFLGHRPTKCLKFQGLPQDCFAIFKHFFYPPSPQR